MERKVLQLVTAVMTVLTVGVCFVLLNYSDLHMMAMQKQVEFAAKKSAGYSVLDLMKDETEILKSNGKDEGLENQIRLELPASVLADQVKINNVYVNQTIEITIPNIKETYFFDYPMVGSSDHIQDIVFETRGNQGLIQIVTDDVYELKVTEKDTYLYLEFLDPREIYDKILVVDAGHGGSAPGATKQGISEKDIDLAIVKQLKVLLDDCEQNIGVYYTRLDDSNPSLEQRAALANQLSADLFLSVHNNSTASGRMSSINGTEVLYQVADTSGQSKKFAQICLDHLLKNLGSNSKGIVAGDDIYIIRTATMPVALVEVGFMTNQEELNKLNTIEYQKMCAKALYDGLMQMMEETNE